MAFGTWATVLRDALLEIGAKSPSETIDADEEADGLRRLQGMLGEWAIEGLLVPGFKTIGFEFDADASGKAAYTLGPAVAVPTLTNPAPDIVLERPMEEVYALNYQRSGQSKSWPMKKTSYAVLSEYRDLQRSGPYQYVYDQSHPQARILFDATTDLDDAMQLTYRGHFDDFDLTENVIDMLPYGYREAVVLNLAVKLAPSYGEKDGRNSGLSSDTRRGAMKTKSLIKRRNLEWLEARIDPALISGGTSQLTGHNNYRR